MLGGQLAALFSERNQCNMCFRLILLFMLTTFAAYVGADGLRPYIVVQSIAYSEPFAIKFMLNKQQAPFNGGSKAFTYNKVETGFQWGNWQLGVLERLDYQLEFSSETAELIYLAENRLPPERDREYELRIKAKHNYSRGLRLAYQHRFSSWLDIGMAASYLQGKAFTDGTVQGRAEITADNNYNFQFDADYFYSRDVLFERDVESPDGNGFSLDFRLDWRPSEYFTVQLDVVDLVGRMFWENAPFTTAVALSDTRTLDEEGYVRYNPVIEGTESSKSFTQILQRKIFVAAKYQLLPSFGLLAELQDYDIVQFTSVGAEWCYSSHSCFQALHNTTIDALSMRYQGRRIRIELASDKKDLDQARYVVVQLSLHQVF